MDLDPRHRSCERGRLQIVDDAGSRSPDQNDMAGKQRRIEFPAEHVGGGDGAVALERRVMQPYPSGGVGRHRQRPDADRGQAGIFAKILFAIGAGGAADIGRGADREAQRLGGERWVGLAVECQDQRQPADDIIPLGKLVEKPVAGGRRFQHRQGGNHPGEIVDMAERVVAGKGEAGFRRGRPRLALIGQDEPRHYRHLAHRHRQPLIGIGQCRQQLFRVRRVDAVLGDQRQQHFGRGAVRLGKIDIEGDDRGAGGGQTLHQLRHDRARPRPLADLGEAFDRRCRRCESANSPGTRGRARW